MDNSMLQERLRRPLGEWRKEDFFELICTKCDFYKPDEERLECAAFKMLVGLLKNGVISVEQIAGYQPG